MKSRWSQSLATRIARCRRSAALAKQRIVVACRALTASMALVAAVNGAAAAQDEPAPRYVAPRAVVTPKLLRYAERIVRQYDVDKDGQLSNEEWSTMRGQPALADLDHDGHISTAEFAQHVANFGAGRAIRLSTSGGPLAQGDPRLGSESPEQTAAAAGDIPGQATVDPRRGLKYFAALPAGIPAWFIERDADGDSQLTLAEFSPKLLKNEVETFNRYDLNHDGLLTPKEFLRADKTQKPGG